MIDGIKTLSDVNVKSKRVLVRLDLNSDILNRKLIPSDRLIAPLQTLMELRKRGAITVILAHQGRPGSKDFISLEQHAGYIKRHIKNFKFVNDVIGVRAIKSIKSLKYGDILLLDNVRFVKGELNYKKNKKNKLIKTLAPLFDIYVNDAFSASHREHASIVAFPRVMESCIGRVFEKELKAIKRLNVKNALFVLGGSKPEDNVQLIANSKNKILASGLFGPFCLMSLGVKLGKQNKIMGRELKNYGSAIRKNRGKIIVPIDLAIEYKGKRRDVAINDFPMNKEVLDIGIGTIEKYAREITNSKAVLFKGLAGLCNRPEFSVGTHALLLALAECKGFTVVSGGHTLTMLEKFKIPKSKFSYVSLSGGALIDYLANGTLPGIEALRK